MVFGKLFSFIFYRNFVFLLCSWFETVTWFVSRYDVFTSTLILLLVRSFSLGKKRRKITHLLSFGISFERWFWSRLFHQTFLNSSIGRLKKIFHLYEPSSFAFSCYEIRNSEFPFKLLSFVLLSWKLKGIILCVLMMQEKMVLFIYMQM